MKKKIITIYAAMAALAVAPALSAQEQLHKEITVEREIVPELRAASRLNLYPRQLTFKPSTATLRLSDYTETGEITPMIATLEPAATAPAAPLTPWRGYVDLGYFPISEVSLSAGYAIVQTDATRLNLWGQFDNNSYSGRPSADASKQDLWSLLGVVGLDFSHRFNRGTLSASTAFTYDAFTRSNAFLAKAYGEEIDFDKNQNVLQWDINALWNGLAANEITYHAGAGFGLMDFRKGMPLTYVENMMVKPASERDFNINLGVDKLFGSSSAGVDFNADFASYSRFRRSLPDFENISDAQQIADIANAPGKTLGVLSFTPYYRYSADKVNLKVGARLDFSVNSGKVFHVAPDVTFAVNPASGFGGWIAFGGGEQLNSLRSLFDITPYVSPFQTYKTSNIPLTGDLGLRFGPFRGASLTVQASYAMANDRLLPELSNNGEVLFSGHNLRAWRIKAELNWSWRSFLSLRASYAATLGNAEKNCWIDSYDRARHIVSAAITVTPIKPLSIDLSYNLRMDRSMSVAGAPSLLNLKNENLLHAGVSYRISRPFTVFLRGENLLNCRSRLIGFVPRQGITGFVGIGYKF